MMRSEIIKTTLDKYDLSDSDRDWAERLIDSPLGEVLTWGGDGVDFTGSNKVLVAVIATREALAKASTGLEF